MITREPHEQIERYLSGEMAFQERYAFEQLLKQDDQLADEVQKHKLLLKSMHLYGRRQQLKKQMDTFHQQLEEEGIPRELQVSHYKWITMWKKYLPTMAVAASVAIISVIGTLLTLNHLRSLDDRQTIFYKQLKRDNDKFRKTLLEEFSNAVSHNQGVTDSKPARYGATGFMVSPNGYLVTNYHVVKDADSIYVETTTDKVSYKVKVIHRDEAVDLALLKIEDPNFYPLRRLPFSLRTKEADLAEPVYTLGYPGDELVYNDGSISAHTGYDGDTSAYRVSIPVNPGNSGGPLLDENGYLLGIVNGKNTAAEGAAFAIKSKHILRMISGIPTDSLPEPIFLPRKNYVKDLKRPEQIKRLQGLVFNVKVFKSSI